MLSIEPAVSELLRSKLLVLSVSFAKML